MKKCKLLLFDLDGTLLQSDKTISTRTLSALKKCRGNDNKREINSIWISLNVRLLHQKVCYLLS